MPAQLEQVWDRVRRELRDEVPDFKFHVWLEPLELAGVEDGRLFVRAPDHMRTWVRDRYAQHLRRAAGRALGESVAVEVVDADWAPQPDAGPGATAARLNPKFSFEQFVIGTSNRFAHSAALAVAELPGQAYNPLFIHGPPGTGKTHLLHAIGNYVTRFGSGLRVRYATVEEFTTGFVRSLHDRTTDDFKRSFREVDVLLVDDIQFLAQKTRTEEEFFHTFNALQAAGRQLVMTSDRSPDELERIERRLGERFGSGLVVGLDLPDPLVRRAIIDKRARLDGLEATPDLLEELAGRVTLSVRALEAAWIQLVAFASVHGRALTPELARQVLKREPQKRLTLEQIVEETASEFGVERQSLLERGRSRQTVKARQVAMFLARELTDRSLPEIGRDVGGRDHSTVHHAVERVRRDLGSDQELGRRVDSLRERLAPSG